MLLLLLFLLIPLAAIFIFFVLMRFIFKSSGWCWCAEQDTGRQIPNTSVQHARPECGGGDEEDPMAGEEREWKKCPGERREQFRRELQELLVGEMSAKTGRWTTKASGPELVPREEQAARWKFQQMDRNRDRVREKNLFLLFVAIAFVNVAGYFCSNTIT